MRALAWLVCLALALLSTTYSLRVRAEEETRVVVAVGNNEGLSGEQALDYAEDDALRFRDVAVELGGVRPERAYLLKGTTASEVLSTLAVVRGRLEELATRGPTALMVYISAHGDAESVHLSGTRLPLVELRAALAQMPTRFRLIVIDACQTAVQVRSKGGSPGPDVPVVVQGQADAAGEVFIASASPGEPAQEWSYLSGALFTHHLLAALRGVADFDRDGNISLTEAYSYAYRRTVADAALASAQPQRPRFDFQFHGFGDFSITRPARLSAAIVLGPELTGRFLVVDSEQKLVVDFSKSDAEPVRVALRPGWYRVVQPAARKVRATDVNLAWGGTKNLRGNDFVELPHWQSRLRAPEPIVLRPYRLRLGYAASTGSVSGLGIQHWLEVEEAWHGRRGFVFAGLGGSTDQLTAPELRVRHREARLRVGGGVRAAWGLWALSLGVETQLAWARQAVERVNGEQAERVFDVREQPRQAVWAGLGGLVTVELALSERWFVALGFNAGAQRLVGGNQDGSALYVQGRISLGWSF